MLIYKHKVYQSKFFIWVVLVLEYNFTIFLSQSIQKVNLECNLLVTLLVTWYQFILIVSWGLNMSSRLIITCSIYSLYSVMFWGYRKGSRANSNWESVGIKCIYHKWSLTDLWLVDLIFKSFKKAKLDKQQMMLLSLRSNPQTMSS